MYNIIYISITIPFAKSDLFEEAGITQIAITKIVKIVKFFIKKFILI